MIGLGEGISFIPSVVVLTKYFDKGLPLAVAVASSGVGVGIFIFPLFVNFLQESLGWRYSLLVCSAISLLMLVSAMLFRPLPDAPNPTTSTGKKKLLRLKMLRQPTFFCLLVNNVLLLYGIVGFYVHLPSHVLSIGSQDSALLLSVAGVSTLFSRLIVGILVQRLQAPLIFYIVSMSLAGLSIIVVAFIRHEIALIIGCGMFGVGSATLGPLLPLIMKDMLGTDAIGDGYGYIMVAEGIGSLIGPPVAGALFDQSHSYEVTLILNK